MHRAIAVLALSGCNLIFSAAPTPDAAGDGVPPSPLGVNGRFHDWYGYSDPSDVAKAKVEQRQVPLVPTCTVRLRDGQEVPLTIDTEAATFAFERTTEGEPYAIVINHEGQTFEIQHDVAVVDFVRRNVGSPSAVIASAGATLSFTPLTPANSRALVTGSGVARELNNQGVFPWTNQFLVDTTHGDRLYLADLGTLGQPPHDYSYIEQIGAGPAPFAQTNAAQVIGAPLQQTQPTLCANVTSLRATELGRVVGAQGASWTANEATWTLAAVRSRDVIGALGRLELAFNRARLSNGSVGNTVAAAVTYADPFPDHDLVAGQIVLTTRPVAKRGAAETKVLGGTAQFTRLDPTVSPSCTTVTLGTGMSIPTDILLGGEKIDGLDGRKDVSFTRTGAGDLLLTWTAGATGRADFYVVQLVELIGDGAGGTDTNNLRTYIAKDAAVAVARESLVPGASYVFRIIGFAGFPDAQRGDFRTIEYPQSQVTTVTTSFTVIN